MSPPAEAALRQLGNQAQALYALLKMARRQRSSSDFVLASNLWPEFWRTAEQLANYECPRRLIAERAEVVMRWHHVAARHGTGTAVHAGCLYCTRDAASTAAA